MHFLVIDLGTQSIKVAIANHLGEIIAKSQQSQEVYSPKSGWAQQKPQLWWDLTKKAIIEVIKKSSIKVETIKGICTCGQMHGPVGIGENGDITTEWTQIWMDKRCEECYFHIAKDCPGADRRDHRHTVQEGSCSGGRESGERIVVAEKGANRCKQGQADQGDQRGRAHVCQLDFRWVQKKRRGE